MMRCFVIAHKPHHELVEDFVIIGEDAKLGVVLLLTQGFEVEEELVEVHFLCL